MSVLLSIILCGCQSEDNTTLESIKINNELQRAASLGPRWMERSRRWCSMANCSNRAKARPFYQKEK